LLDQTGNIIQQGKVPYHAPAVPVELGFTLTSSNSLQDDQQTISLAIQNKGTEKTVAGQLKLKITRKEGDKAQLEHEGTLLLKQSQNVCLVELSMLDPNTTLPYNLIIKPGDDSKASFMIELAYEGNKVGDPIPVSWEGTSKVKVVRLDYDRSDKKIYYTISNQGIAKASNVTLTYTVKTLEAKLRGVSSQKITIVDLNPSEQKDFNIEDLDFGSNSSNKSVVIEFAFSYEENGDKKTMPSFLKTFIKADINLELLTNYDNKDRKASITVKNFGYEDAEGVKLVYKNMSGDAKGKLATLDGNQQGVLDIDKIEKLENFSPGGYKKDYALNLQEASTATFYFEVQYDGKPIASHTETFEEEAQLSLDVQEPGKDQFYNYNLYGADNQIALHIQAEGSSCPIEIKYLKLVIRQGSGNALSIARTPDGALISELADKDLGELRDELKLYAKPVPGAKEADVTFQLQYKGKDIGDPVTIHWKEYELWLGGPEMLVGDSQAQIKIDSPHMANVAPSELTVVLESDNGNVSPKWLDQNMDSLNSSSATLNQVGYNFPLVYFQVSQTNNPTKAQLQVIVKRGTTELARKKMTWLNEGISLNISVGHPLFSDAKELKIILTNKGTTPIDLNQVQVQLVNTAGSEFRLGNVSGTTIHQNLAKITGENALAANDSIDIYLKIDQLLGDKFFSGITIELIDISNNLVIQKSHYCCHSDQLPNLMDALLAQQGIDDIQDAIDEAEKHEYLESLVKYLLILEEIGKKHQDVLDQCNRIAASDTSFKAVLGEVNKFYLSKMNTLKGSIGKIQNIFTDWYNQGKEVIKPLQYKIEIGNKASNQFQDIEEVTKFLTADWVFYKAIHQQSVQALYQAYNQKIDLIKVALTANKITNLDPAATDLPAIKELKQLYQTMAADLLNVKKDAPAVFTQVIKGVIERKQQQIKEAIDKKEKDNDDSYNFIAATKNLLIELAKISKAQTADLGFDPIEFDSLLAINYQTLVEKLVELVEFDQEDLLHEDALMSIEIKEMVTQIFKSTKNGTTKQATKKTIEATVKVWEKLKDKKGEYFLVTLENSSQITVKDQLIQLTSELALLS